MGSLERLYDDIVDDHPGWSCLEIVREATRHILARAEKAEAQCRADLARFADCLRVEAERDALKSEVERLRKALGKAYADIAETCADLLGEYMATPEAQLHESGRTLRDRLAKVFAPLEADAHRKALEEAAKIVEAHIGESGGDDLHLRYASQEIRARITLEAKRGE